MKTQSSNPVKGKAPAFVAGMVGALGLFTLANFVLKPSFESAVVGAFLILAALYARMGLRLREAEGDVSELRELATRMTAAQKAAEKQADTPDDDEPALEIVSSQPSLDAGEALSDADRRTLMRLKDAIQSKRLELYLQPIVSLPQRRPRFYEAFSRLRDAEGRLLTPRDYLDAAERANRIGVVDNLILLRSVQTLRELHMSSTRTTVFCNISPATLYDTKFFEQFVEYLETNEDLAPHLVFEFTWPAVQLMDPSIEAALIIIAQRGFAFSVDHVHTLDIDIQRLRALNFRYLKASTSLLRAPSGPDAAEAASRLAAFRSRLADAGVDLIAEKTESEDDIAALADLEVDFGQGNLFGPPRRADQYLNLRRDAPMAKAS